MGCLQNHFTTTAFMCGPLAFSWSYL
jgi:hypothetical protein